MGIKLPLRSSSGYQPQWYHSSLWSKDSSKCKGSPNKKYEGAILSMTYLTCEGCLASNRYAPGRTLFVNGVLKYNTYNTNVDIMAIFIKVFHLWKSAEFQIRTQYAKWLKGSYNRRAYDLICLLMAINDLQYNHQMNKRCWWISARWSGVHVPWFPGVVSTIKRRLKSFSNYLIANVLLVVTEYNHFRRQCLWKSDKEANWQIRN